MSYLVTILNLMHIPLPLSVFQALYSQNTGEKNLWDVFRELVESEQGTRIKEEAFRGMGYFLRQALNLLITLLTYR